MNFKKILPYLGAILLVITAAFGILKALSGAKDTPAWDQLATSVKQVQSAADLATTAAVGEKKYDVCVSSSVTSSVAGAVVDSLAGAQAGTCRIPDLSVDVSKCIALKAPAASPEVAPVAPSPVASEVMSVTVKDFGPMVDLALGPVLTIVQGAVASSDASPAVKAWSAGVTAWLASGKESLVAFVADPKEGKLSFKGVAIEGCSP